MGNCLIFSETETCIEYHIYLTRPLIGSLRCHTLSETLKMVLQQIKEFKVYIFFRDFAYVARDRTTRKHMCHVFRCDMPARTIANTLRDICKKIMIERSLQQNLGKSIDINGKSLATRPNNLPMEHRRPARNSQVFICKCSSCI